MKLPWRDSRTLIPLIALPVLFAIIGCGAGGAGSTGAAHEASSSIGALSATSAIPASSTSTVTASTATPKRPNIVFVLTDDLSWNLVRYMPHVLAMERAGETFSNYFVTDSLCCPSRASIFTGRFPHDTGVYSNTPPDGGIGAFDEHGDQQDTFAVALQRSGYRTALMGKYLNGYQPEAGLASGSKNVPPGWSEWDVAGDGYPEFDYAMNSDGHVVHYGSRPREYLTDVLAEKGRRFIATSAKRGRPFLLELSTFAPHGPFVPAPRDARDFHGLKAPRDPAFDRASIDPPAWLSHYAPLRSRQIHAINRDFRRRAQSVQAVDRMIGELEAELKAKGVSNDTYIVFSSDNGLHMGEHRLEPGKLTAFDTDIHVPLIVVGPNVPSGRTVNAMSENIDLCPTFEQLAGAPVPRAVDGRSLRPLLQGKPAPNWRREILVEHRGPDIGRGDPDLPTHGAGNPPSYEAIRTPSSLYVEYGTGEREYYDLRRDPFELRNIAARLSPVHRRRLHRTLAAIERCHGGRSCWRAQHGVI